MSTDNCSTQLGETNAGVTRSRNDATELKATILVLSDPESGSSHALYKAVEETIVGFYGMSGTQVFVHQCLAIGRQTP